MLIKKCVGIIIACALLLGVFPASALAQSVDRFPFENPDVIVIGAGFAGVNAAIAASENGAKVYLIEKNQVIGGSIRYAGGTTSAAGAQMQIDADVDDSPENFAEDILRMGGGTNIEALTVAHTNHAADAIDFLDELGVDFGDRQPHMSSSYDAFNTPREYRAKGGGMELIQAVTPLLDQAIEEENVHLMLNTRVKDLIVEDDAVVGVVIDDKDETEYRAPAVILATGGYGHNEDLINRYNFANVLTMSPEFCTGDGFIFAEKAGALFNNMDYLPAYPGGVPVGEFELTCTAKVQNYADIIWVDLDGKRIVNEYDALDSERKDAYASAKENLVYILLTDEIKENSETPLLSVGKGFAKSPDDEWTYFEELIAEEDCVFSAATLEEVAEKAGVDADGLVQTVSEYNDSVKSGEDDAFNRPAESMKPIEGKEFYLVKTCPYVMLTKGGPVMNEKAQVLNQNNEPIPGLFQCGEIVGGANIGGNANIGGLANTICVVWGKIAGENAAMEMMAVPAAAEEYVDGEYQGTAQGMNGAVDVTVSVENGRIKTVVVDDHSETPGLSDPAIEQIPLAIVEQQSFEVDIVAGATITSDAIMLAGLNALENTSESEDDFDLAIEPDVIVVGAGMAGLVASVRAAELGAKVLVFEQSSRVGGSANTAGGSISGTKFRAQVEAGIEDSPEKFYEDFVSMGGGEENMNTEIAFAHAERSGQAIDWLEQYVGVEMSDQVDTGGYLSMNTDRVTYTGGGPSSGGGLYFVEALLAKLQPFIDQGTVQLALNSKVENLLLDENKDVLGVYVHGMDITAPSVIIATGGYGYSERWLKEFNFTNITSNDPPTATGDGYDFARSAGAAFDNMDYSSCYGGSVPVSGFQASLRCNINYPGAIWVNTAGDRMFNEPAATSMDKRTVWRSADQNIVYVLVSESMLTDDSPLFTGMMSNSAPFTTEEKLLELEELGYAFKADTVDELGDLIDAKNLAATVDTYNEDVEAGEDSEFGRTEELIAFDGPLYAIHTVPYLMMTAGGPRINDDAALVREDGSIVENVYIAGEIIGSANIAGHNTIGGIGHALCATWGQIAAESAVENARK